MKLLQCTAALVVIIVLSLPTETYAASTKCLPGSLKYRLSQLSSKFGGLRIISTYRKGAKIRGKGRSSKHASCKAVDFKINNR